MIKKYDKSNPVGNLALWEKLMSECKMIEQTAIGYLFGQSLRKKGYLNTPQHMIETIFEQHCCIIEAKLYKKAQVNKSLIKALYSLPDRWRSIAMASIPDIYNSKKLRDKYLRLNVEEAGIIRCADELYKTLKG